MKKNKKGFSIIEILGVLILLSLILIITIPIIEKNIKSSNINSLNTIKGNIISATKNWAADNAKLLPIDSNSSITITLGMLKQGNYVDNNIYNPVEKKNISNETRIRIEKVEEYYNYTLDDVINTNDTESIDKPYIILKGATNISVPINTNYIEAGADAYYNGITKPVTIKYYDKDTNDNFQEVSTINTNIFNNKGTNYYRDYKAIYSYENIKAERNINIVDTQPPIVEFINIRIENGIYYHPQGLAFNINNIELKIKDNSCGLDGATTTVNDCSFLTARPHAYITTTNNINPNVVGNYNIEYKVRDAKGNINTAILNVKVENYDPILVNGSDANENIEVNTTYAFKTLKIKRHVKAGGQEITLSKVSPDTINTSIVGSTTNVIYKYTDNYTNKEYTFTKVVKVVDTTKPTLVLNDSNIVNNILTVGLNQTIQHPNFTIKDNSCGTNGTTTNVNNCVETLKAIASRNIDTSTVQSYIIKYTAKDSSNNVSDEINITIKVINPEYIFSYNENEQNYTIPVKGKYELTIHGAGGSASTNYAGGLGGYVVVKVDLNAGDVVKVLTGSTSSGGTGYINGGGSTTYKVNSSAILVAAGGGGAASANAVGTNAGNGGKGGAKPTGCGTAGADGTNYSGGGSSQNCSYNTTTTTYTYNEESSYGGYPSCESFSSQRWVAGSVPCSNCDIWPCGAYCTYYRKDCKRSVTTTTTNYSNGNPGNGGNNYIETATQVTNTASNTGNGHGKIKLTN